MVKNTIGIIDPCDYLSEEAFGGTMGFVNSIVPYMKPDTVIIFGLSYGDSIPWKRYKITSNVTFIPIERAKSSSIIPMRLKAFMKYMYRRRRILKSGCDILYIHSPETCLPFLKNYSKIPIIYHRHGSDNPLARSKFKYARKNLIKKSFDLILNSVHIYSDWIITIDKLCLEYSRNIGTIYKSSLLMNGVDTMKFYPSFNMREKIRNRYKLSDNECCILFVGRVEKNKGVEYLIDCIPFFKKMNFNSHIFIAGNGSDTNNIRKKIQNENIISDVTFLGRVSHRNLIEFYNMADVLALPSEMEGVPMVILESLSCGTPVVASDVGGIPEIINDTNGIVPNEISGEAFSRAIVEVYLKKLERLSVAKTVYELSAKNYVKKFKKIINENLMDNR